MCDVCQSENKDDKVRNGFRNVQIKREFKRVYSDSVAVVTMCYIHDIELFVKGERRFLTDHKDFAYELARNVTKYARERRIL